VPGRIRPRVPPATADALVALREALDETDRGLGRLRRRVVESARRFSAKEDAPTEPSPESSTKIYTCRNVGSSGHPKGARAARRVVKEGRRRSVVGLSRHPGHPIHRQPDSSRAAAREAGNDTDLLEEDWRGTWRRGSGGATGRPIATGVPEARCASTQMRERECGRESHA